MFIFPLNALYIYIVNTATIKNLEIPNVKKLILGTMEKEASQYLPKEMLEFNFEIFTKIETDVKSVVKAINKLVVDFKQSSINNLPTFITVQTPYKISKLIATGLSCLYNDIPFVELPFNIQDGEIPPLDWVRFCVKKLAFRYLELEPHLSHRIRLSQYCNLPLCNIENDNILFCSDVIFARLLKSSKQILWYSSSGFPDLGGGSDDTDFLGEIEFEFPKISAPGMYLGYSVEIDIGLFCVNAILESDHMKDISGNYEINLIDPK